MYTKLFSCDSCAIVFDGTKIRKKNAEKVFQYDPQMVIYRRGEHIPLHKCPVCGFKMELDQTMWDGEIHTMWDDQ